MNPQLKFAQRLAFAGIAIALATCDGIDTFRLTETSQSTIPQGTVLERFVGDLGFGGFLAMDLSQNQELQNQGVKKNQIDSVFLADIAMTITAPQDADFTFIDSLEFYVESAGLPRQRIAYGGPFTPGERTVSLSVDEVDLSAYVAAEAMEVTTRATGRRPPQDTTISASMDFVVDVNVGGAICGE